MNVYLNAFGVFLPGNPIPNEKIENILGKIHGKSSLIGKKILAQNGIQYRYYALNEQGESVYGVCSMATQAILNTLKRGECDFKRVGYLAAASSQADLPVPGLASMIHGELKSHPMEIATFHGVCSSGIQGISAAVNAINAGKHRAAIACASEFPSRIFKATQFQDQLQPGERLPFDTEFLRWMLSDGAGATFIENVPNTKGLSLRVDWIQIRSHAHNHEVCMYAGANNTHEGSLGKNWLDYPSSTQACADGACNLKQDVRRLDALVALGVSEIFELIDQGKIHPETMDYYVCHYSSKIFKQKIIDLFAKGGLVIPEDKWFSNLHQKGNTGSASLLIMLEELFYSGKLKPGNKIVCTVPESGRFTMAHMALTVVSMDEESIFSPVKENTISPPALFSKATQENQYLFRQLSTVWVEFEAHLNQIPIIKRLHQNQFRIEDYQTLLLNLRQQVVEGARWIARAASHLSIEVFHLRSLFLSHAKEEHRDYQMLERDYISVGGRQETMENTPKNIGSEALSAWMFHQSSQPNPFDLLGAMFIIEGLGNRVAEKWGKKIQKSLNLQANQVSFLLYHGNNDGNHLNKLAEVIETLNPNKELSDRIIKTAKVTARLYCLQLEELSNT